MQTKASYSTLILYNPSLIDAARTLALTLVFHRGGDEPLNPINLQPAMKGCRDFTPDRPKWPHSKEGSSSQHKRTSVMYHDFPFHNTKRRVDRDIIWLDSSVLASMSSPRRDVPRTHPDP